MTMEKELIAKTKQEMTKAVEFFSKELGKIRTSHASPAMVEDVMVQIFQGKMTLKQLASISNQAPRELVSQPWGRS